MYRLLGDLIVVLHLAFVVFVVTGALLVLRRPRIVWIHVPAVLWGALVEFAGWICPLTPLENYFRELAGHTAYRGDFIDQYVVPLVYPDDLSRTMQVTFGLIVLIVNGFIYGLVLRTHTRRGMAARRRRS